MYSYLILRHSLSHYNISDISLLPSSVKGYMTPVIYVKGVDDTANDDDDGVYGEDGSLLRNCGLF